MTVKDIQDETKSKLYACIFLMALLCCLYLAGSALIDSDTSPYLPYIYGTVCSFLVVSCLGIGHNFVHHKDNIFKHFYLLAGFTAEEWQMMHCISHHSYPNL